jgi:hypothetical protein
MHLLSVGVVFVVLPDEALCLALHHQLQLVLPEGFRLLHERHLAEVFGTTISGTHKCFLH